MTDLMNAVTAVLTVALAVTIAIHGIAALLALL